MAISRNQDPKWRIHPGEILREEFLAPLNLKPAQLAKELGVSAPTVNDIVREKRAISAEMAVLLAKFFNTTGQFWLNMQAAYDIHRAKTHLAKALKRIKSRAHAA
jgi:addiction module HigA family antidote